MDKYMLFAINEAKEGITKGHGGPFGSVIVKDGVVVGKGHNRVLLNNDPTCHGEMEAIRDASRNLKTYDLTGCVLYTTAEPCPMCFGAILWSNIREVYYGCNVIDTDNIGFRDNIFYNTNKEDVLKSLDRDECLKLFEEYKNIKNKIIY